MPSTHDDTAPSSLVLLAHGSRDERWHAPFRALRDRLAAHPSSPLVIIAYLQFGGPTLSESLQLARQGGATQVLVVPVFLSGGGHLLRDVPQVVAAAAAAFPELKIRCSAALGEEPEVMEGMTRACHRLLHEQRPSK
jgi:sirohydrochlorin cobaltochelatase